PAPGAARRFAAAAAAGVPLPIPTSTQFDITGFLQEAHTAGPDAPGTLRVNGQVVTIPVNTVVILPAAGLTWDELFTQAPAPYGPAQTGLAMFDTPAPLTTSEVHVIGNRVTTAAGGDQYIAGLVYLSQQSLNAGAGFINFIDYGAGELRVGGLLGDPSTGARVRIIEGQQSQIPDTPGAQTAANGLVFGQYHAPILEYIFPENVPGTPIVPNNFEAIPFLACGGMTFSDGTVAGPLQPWPGAVAPVCANAPSAPVANAGAAVTVASGATVTLAGSATGTAPLAFSWAQTAGPTVALSDPTIASPSFAAPAVTVTTALTFALTVTNAVGSSTATVTVTVNAAAAPTVVHIADRTVASGTPVSMTATCSDPNGGTCSFVWTQTSGTPVVLTPNPFAGATVSFQVALAAGAAPAVLQFQIVATSSAGVSSAPDLTAVTVTSPPDTVQITSAEYRADKQRLILTATSSVVSPNVNLTLQPYVTATGTTFDPAAIGNTFTNGGAGTYTLTVVGAPQPAAPPATPLTARSSAGGVSPPHGLDRLR
ncbi:MAG TPA: hypothetical protein VF516_01815, partial [Kofleriaceae bacterium]